VFYCVFSLVVSSVVNRSAVKCLAKLISEMAYCVSSEIFYSIICRLSFLYIEMTKLLLQVSNSLSIYGAFVLNMLSDLFCSLCTIISSNFQ